MREMTGLQNNTSLQSSDLDCSVQKQSKCKRLILNGIEPKFTQLQGFLEGLCSLKERVRVCSAGGEAWKKGRWATLEWDTPNLPMMGYQEPLLQSEWVLMPMV